MNLMLSPQPGASEGSRLSCVMHVALPDHTQPHTTSPVLEPTPGLEQESPLPQAAVSSTGLESWSLGVGLPSKAALSR